MVRDEPDSRWVYSNPLKTEEIILAPPHSVYSQTERKKARLLYYFVFKNFKSSPVWYPLSWGV